jgi:hypothetical protein
MNEIASGQKLTLDKILQFKACQALTKVKDRKYACVGEAHPA